MCIYTTYLVFKYIYAYSYLLQIKQQALIIFVIYFSLVNAILSVPKLFRYRYNVEQISSTLDNFAFAWHDAESQHI